MNWQIPFLIFCSLFSLPAAHLVARPKHSGYAPSVRPPSEPAAAHCVSQVATDTEQPSPPTRSFSFVPPKGWDCLDNKSELPARIEIVYIGKGKNGFTPSINLATEETDLTARDYVNLAKSYHESHPETHCQNLGEVPTPSGSAHLLQIDRKTSFGDVRFLQSLLIRDKIAYVMTATCLHEEFASCSSSFFQSIKTLTILPQNAHEHTP